MNFLLAKTKGRHGEFFKVISGEDFFELPEDLEQRSGGIRFKPVAPSEHGVDSVYPMASHYEGRAKDLGADEVGVVRPH